MKKLMAIYVALLLGLVSCNAPEPGSEIYDHDNTENEREGMETDADVNFDTQEDGVMEEKYKDGTAVDSETDSVIE